eukprot:6415969-Prymnesium_polylepis.2
MVARLVSTSSLSRSPDTDGPPSPPLSAPIASQWHMATVVAAAQVVRGCTGAEALLACRVAGSPEGQVTVTKGRRARC